MEKEAYFTPENLSDKSCQFLEGLESFRHRHRSQILEPSHVALLVLDMQVYFLDSGSHAFVPSAPAILPGIRSLIEAFHSAGRPIIFTRHVNTLQNVGLLGNWWKDIVLPDSPRSEIVPGLDVRKGIVLDKNQYDAFFQTDLGEILCTQEIRQVLITGVMTHLCCETTARSAFMRGYETFFTVDGTATYNEAFYRAALLNLSHGFALPVTVDEVLDAFRH